MLVDRSDDGQEEGQELLIGMRVVAWIEQVLATVGDMDQLLCLPEPLMPANGFSWISSMRPWWRASLRIVDMASWLWSLPTDVASNTGAISY